MPVKIAIDPSRIVSTQPKRRRMKISNAGSPIMMAIGMKSSTMNAGVFILRSYQYKDCTQPGKESGLSQRIQSGPLVPLNGIGTCEKSSGQLSTPSCSPGPSWADFGTGTPHSQPVWIARMFWNGASAPGHSQSLSTRWATLVTTLTWRPASYRIRPTVKTDANAAEKSAILTAFGVPNQTPCPALERSMYGIMNRMMIANVGAITPPSAGCMCSSSSWKLARYQAAFDGLGVMSRFASFRSGASRMVERMMNASVKTTAAMNSTKTRSGQTRSSCSRSRRGRAPPCVLDTVRAPAAIG